MRSSRSAWFARVATIALVAGATISVVWFPTPAGAVVATDAEFRLAFETAATTAITVAADIDLQCPALARASANPLTIDGGGFRLTEQCAAADILALTGAGALTLNDLALDGNALNSGVGIDSNSADVTLNNSVITDTGNDGIDIGTSAAVVLTNSRISGTGGTGISTFGGTVTLTDSTIAQADGDGIASDADVHLTGSTISDNDGNGVDSNGADNTLTNSTVSGNNGTGLATNHTMTLVYATIVNNNVADSNGFNLDFNGGGAYESFGSVIAVSAGGAAANCNTGGTYTSHGFNFSDDDSCFTAGSDISDGGSPELGGLAMNGGSTGTMLPQDGSPLIDAIPSASCQDDGAAGITDDQRGVTRPEFGGCDIGAVEVSPNATATTVTTPTPTSVSPTPTTVVETLPRTGGNGGAITVGIATLLAGGALLMGVRRRSLRSRAPARRGGAR